MFRSVICIHHGISIGERDLSGYPAPFDCSGETGKTRRDGMKSELVNLSVPRGRRDTKVVNFPFLIDCVFQNDSPLYPQSLIVCVEVGFMPSAKSDVLTILNISPQWGVLRLKGKFV